MSMGPGAKLWPAAGTCGKRQAEAQRAPRQGRAAAGAREGGKLWLSAIALRTASRALLSLALSGDPSARRARRRRRRRPMIPRCTWATVDGREQAGGAGTLVLPGGKVYLRQWPQRAISAGNDRSCRGCTDTTAGVRGKPLFCAHSCCSAAFPPINRPRPPSPVPALPFARSRLLC